MDTDLPEPDGGVMGWEMTWAVQAGGDKVNLAFPYDIVFDLDALSDGSVVVSGRYVFEGLFGAGGENETHLPRFGTELDWDNTNDFIARYGLKGELLWAKGYGGEVFDMGGMAIADLGDGGILTIGGYDAQVTVGIGEPNEMSFFADTFETSGLYSSVLARFSTETGELEWALPALDAGFNTRLNGMAVLPDGSPVVAGWFSKEVAFAPDSPEQTVLTTTGTGDSDVAIARFDEAGLLIWVKQIAGSGMERLWSIVRLLDGSLLAAGSYQQTIVLGAGEENETPLTCAPLDGCVFLAEYSAEDGSLQWAEDLGYSCSEQNLFPRIVAAPDGGFAISGAFVGSGVLGQGEPNETVIGPTLEDKSDLLVARYAAGGNLLWARQSVGGIDEPASSDLYVGYPMAFLDSGELAVAGYYRHGGPVLGSGEPNETILPNENDLQIFIALYYPNGNLAWAIEQGGPSGMDAAASVTAYGDSTFFVGGSFGDTVTFGTSSEDQKTMASSGDSEIFVLRFDRTTE